MGDTENAVQPSKKRVAGTQLSRDNPGLDDDETTEQEAGTFKRASDEVMANRRIVKVRRNPTSSDDSAPSSNPFAGIRLVPPVDTSAAVTTEPESEKLIPEKVKENTDVNNKGEKETDKNLEQSDNADDLKDQSAVDAEKTDSSSRPSEPTSVDEETAGKKTEDDGKKDTEIANSESEAAKDMEHGEPGKEGKGDVSNESIGKSSETTPFSSFQQLSSSQNAFTGLAGTGFSGSTFSFGAISKDSSSQSSGSTFSFGAPTNGRGSLFGSAGASIVKQSEENKFTPMQEVSVESGEENEKPIFTADSVLFEYSDGGWKERGKGELRLNVPTAGIGKARLIMRTRGNYRLVMNANLFPEMKLTDMDKKGITFACVNSAGDAKDGLSTYALKFKDATIVEEFRAAVLEHKGKPAVALRTPENSPRNSDE